MTGRSRRGGYQRRKNARSWLGLVYNAVPCSRLSGPAQELEIGDVGSLRLQSCVARAVVESANSSLNAQMGTRRRCV